MAWRPRTARTAVKDTTWDTNKRARGQRSSGQHPSHRAACRHTSPRWMRSAWRYRAWGTTLRRARQPTPRARSVRPRTPAMSCWEARPRRAVCARLTRGRADIDDEYEQVERLVNYATQLARSAETLANSTATLNKISGLGSGQVA